MRTRRSFLFSIIASIAAAPLLCRARDFVRKEFAPLELWEMESEWDGTLSPHFLGIYGYGRLRSVAWAGTQEERQAWEKKIKEMAFKQESFSKEDYIEHTKKLSERFACLENAPSSKPEPGSFVASIFPEA